MISNALILIGDAPISSLNDVGAGAIAAANLYDSSYLNMLSIHRWRFAAKKAQLSKLAEAPLNGYDYQYQLPTDMLILHRVEEGRKYELYQDKLYTDFPDVSIDYTFSVSEDFLPPYFAKAFEFFLAAQFAIPVTTNSTRAREYYGMYEKQLRIAKAQDSMQRPPRLIQDNPIDLIFS